ncbi:MAG: hypothetical protein QNJ46_00630 [Leptolyngbyaceae cyanobacterium MO_188.B28]|nr:hypothetical protein [Leptolyngbyaceae cyanobacterium MO_188.B28]
MVRQGEGQVAKVFATAIIWAFATGMLGICVPLVNSTNSGVILPFLAILGASVSTIVVWRPPNPRVRQLTEKVANLQTLEQRVKNLEAICSSPEFDLQKALKQIESKDRL